MNVEEYFEDFANDCEALLGQIKTIKSLPTKAIDQLVEKHKDTIRFHTSNHIKNDMTPLYKLFIIGSAYIRTCDILKREYK